MKFTTKEACEISGASYRQLDDWERQSALIPSIRRSNGSGSRRVYSDHDVILAAILVDLSALGFTVEQKIRVVNMFRMTHPILAALPDEIVLDVAGRRRFGNFPPVSITVRPRAYLDRLPVPLPV